MCSAKPAYDISCLCVNTNRKLKFQLEKFLNKLDYRKRLSKPPCAEMREGDGIDPRFMKKNYDSSKQNYQNQRLCKQIEKTLTLIFSGCLYDSRFDGLFVDSVTPEPDMATLMVTVIPLNDPQPDPHRIKLFLESVKGYLRSEVAHEISRKKMPDLKFRIKVESDNFIK